MHGNTAEIYALIKAQEALHTKLAGSSKAERVEHLWQALSEAAQRFVYSNNAQATPSKAPLPHAKQLLCHTNRLCPQPGQACPCPALSWAALF